MAGNGRNSLRAALQERGWSYTRLAAELRRHAAGAQLPKTESLVRLISRWVNNHQQPDDFYRDLLAKALRRSRAELFHDEGTQTELVPRQATFALFTILPRRRSRVLRFRQAM